MYCWGTKLLIAGVALQSGAVLYADMQHVDVQTPVSHVNITITINVKHRCHTTPI